MKYLTILLITLFLISCGKTPPEIIVETKFIEQTIPIKIRPDKPNIINYNYNLIKFHEGGAEIYSNTGNKLKYEDLSNSVWIATTIKDYEITTLNAAELLRYQNQLESLLDYYENSITNTIE